MSALAGPGDLAGSLGEMAAERRHLLRVWAAGMLAEVSFGLETQATAQAEPLAGTCHLLPGSWTAQPGSTLFFLPPNQQSMGKRGAHKGAPSFSRKHVESGPHHGPEAPGLVVSWSSVCVCDQNPRGSRWVNVTLW